MNQIVQNHAALADVVTLTAGLGSSFAWVMGWLPGVVAVLVGIWAIAWYTVQILDSDWNRKRKQRNHRRKVRRMRTWGV